MKRSCDTMVGVRFPSCGRLCRVARVAACVLLALTGVGGPCLAAEEGASDGAAPEAVKNAKLATVDPRSLAADDIQDVWLLSPPRPPCLIRFHIRRAGIGYVSAWGEFLIEQFERLDRNGDFLLDQSEFGHGPWELVPLRRRALAERQSQPVDFLAIDVAPDDDFVSLDELLAALGKSGVHVRTPIVSEGGGGEADYLFELLDVDGNGRVSAAEADEAPGLLARWDTNGDEALAPSEVVLALATRRRQSGLDTKAPERPKRYILAPPALARPDEIADELMAAAQNVGTRTLGGISGAAGFALPAGQARPGPTDAAPPDREGWLSLLDGWAPDAEFRVSLDAEGKATLALARADDAPSEAGNVQVVSQGAFAAEVTAPDGALLNVSTVAPGEFNAQVTENQFKQADGDNNGYLDRREASQYGYRATFSRMDTDHNNQVFLEEFLPFLQQQFSHALRRTDLTVTPQSSVLITAVQEGPNDGFLSPAELSAVGRRVREYDRDGDGQFALVERVERFQISIGAGAGDVSNNNDFSQLQAPVQLAGFAGGRDGSGSGVAWFDGMDANRDGLVSRREFLGKPEEFARWDRDQDGLIEAVEARAGLAK